ncbi:MAG: PDZ domain-containing protein [Candidatus Marinimicrobia bacterium]|nr:PDZ domain-containing protein [Candidatus Neomarinimicrobiota bacterium]MCF7829162.1 PDZ domain-containing protein [Candidatus Neomarinimicrobiota bacterium]MCF7881185.1 PDZ domain-containing protein [Candidatus Neomarinimicrobiota bacterium]
MKTINGRTKKGQRLLRATVMVFCLIFVAAMNPLAGQTIIVKSSSGDFANQQSDIKRKVIGSDSSTIRIGIESSSDERPLFGVFLDDLDFEQAYKMHYDYTYGVLVDGVVSSGAAEQAGLMENDIIMEFDGKKVQHEDHLVRMIRSKRVGDPVEVKYFRDGHVKTTSAILQGKESKEQPKPQKSEFWTRDAGNGGLTFYASWYEPDHEPISQLLSDMGFSDVRSDPPVGGGDLGLLMRGFHVQFEGDNNWLWGFDFNDYESNRRAATNANRRLDYEFGYWGFTMDKRIPIIHHLILSGGFTAGFASYDLKMYEMQENYRWGDLNQQMANSVNNYMHLQKKYLMGQPRASAIVRFTDWLGVRGTVGYMLGYSYHTRWNAHVVDDNIEVENSPETSINGLTYSVGLWFDFF